MYSSFIRIRNAVRSSSKVLLMVEKWSLLECYQRRREKQISCRKQTSKINRTTRHESLEPMERLDLTELGPNSERIATSVLMILGQHFFTICLKVYHDFSAARSSFLCCSIMIGHNWQRKLFSCVHSSLTFLQAFKLVEILYFLWLLSSNYDVL